MPDEYGEPTASEIADLGVAVSKELERVTNENRQLQRRVNDLMTEKAEVIKHAKGLQRQLDKLRKPHAS